MDCERVSEELDEGEREWVVEVVALVEGQSLFEVDWEAVEDWEGDRVWDTDREEVEKGDREGEGDWVRLTDTVLDTLPERDPEVDLEVDPEAVGKSGDPLGEREGGRDGVPEALEFRVVVKDMVKVKDREREKVKMADWLGVVEREVEGVREGTLLVAVTPPLMLMDREGERVTVWEVEGDFVGVGTVVMDIVAEAPWVKDR